MNKSQELLSLCEEIQGGLGFALKKPLTNEQMAVIADEMDVDCWCDDASLQMDTSDLEVLNKVKAKLIEWGVL